LVDRLFKLYEKYEANFEVSSEGPVLLLPDSKLLLELLKFAFYFSGNLISNLLTKLTKLYSLLLLLHNEIIILFKQDNSCFPICSIQLKNFYARNCHTRAVTVLGWFC
jgi:hypothetical protein